MTVYVRIVGIIPIGDANMKIFTTLKMRRKKKEYDSSLEFKRGEVWDKVVGITLQKSNRERKVIRVQI